MYEILKITHLLALAVSIGGGVANMVLGIRAAGLDPAQAVQLRLSQGTLGRVSLGSLAVLWISGGWLLTKFYGGFSAMGVEFQLKISVVVALSFIAIYFNIYATRAIKAGNAPNPDLAKRVGMVIMVLAIAAVILAVLTFN